MATDKSEKGYMAAAKKNPSDRSDEESAMLAKPGNLPLNVRNELHATEQRVKVHGK